MLRPRACELTQHYQSLVRKAGDLPNRADFHPRDFKDLLPWIFLIKADHEGILRLSLVGSQVDRQLGKGATGSSIFDHYSAHEAPVLEHLMKDLAETRCGGEISRLVSSTDLQDVRCCTTLFLPIRGRDQGEIQFIGTADMSSTATCCVTADVTTVGTLNGPSIGSIHYVDLGNGTPELPLFETKVPAAA